MLAEEESVVSALGEHDHLAEAEGRRLDADDERVVLCRRWTCAGTAQTCACSRSRRRSTLCSWRSAPTKYGGTSMPPKGLASEIVCATRA